MMDGAPAPVHLAAWSSAESASATDETARLVYQAHPEYYDLFCDDRTRLLEAIRSQLLEADSELGNTRILFAGTQVVGVHSWYHASDTDVRKMVSLRILMDVLDPSLAALERLRQFKCELPPIDPDTCYLSRITVAENVRGSGFGQLLIRDFEQEAVRAGCRLVSLHVRGENHRAIRFYEAAGYRTVSPPGLAYIGMHKSLPSSAAA